MKKNLRIAKQLIRLAKRLVAGVGDYTCEPTTYQYSNFVIGNGAGSMMIVEDSPVYSMDEIFNYTEQSLKNSEAYRDGFIDDEDVAMALKADGHSEWRTHFGEFSSVLEFEDAGCTLKGNFGHVMTSGNGFDIDYVYHKGNRPDKEFLKQLPFDIEKNLQ